MTQHADNRIWTILAPLAAVALLFAMVAYENGNTHAAMKTEAAQGFARANAAGSNDMAYVTSAPYRDGLYQGQLARNRGEAAHISSGRWNSAADRTAYQGGYVEGFGGIENRRAFPGK